MHSILRVWKTLAVLLFAFSSSSAQDDAYDWRQGRELHPGIRFIRIEANQPRKMVVHGTRVDAWMPDMRLRTTPRRAEWIEGKSETDRQTTRDFLRRSRSAGRNMVLAVNADAFSPWPVPYDQSTPTDLLGLAVSDGAAVSRGAGSPSLLELKIIPESLEVLRASNLGCPVTLNNPLCAPARAYADAVRRLKGETVAMSIPTDRKSLINKRFTRRAA